MLHELADIFTIPLIIHGALSPDEAPICIFAA